MPAVIYCGRIAPYKPNDLFLSCKSRKVRMCKPINCRLQFLPCFQSHISLTLLTPPTPDRRTRRKRRDRQQDKAHRSSQRDPGLTAGRQAAGAENQ